MSTQYTGNTELDQAKFVIDTEAQCLLEAKNRLGGEFIAALDLITSCIKNGGKVVTMGVGKSGKAADKVAATLCSTGTLAIYLHPTEAAHGDLGVVTSIDVVILFSHSGKSDEIVQILPTLRTLGTKAIAIVGNIQSTIAQFSTVVLNAEIKQEACPLNLAPTSSTTVAIALGDALALALSRRWNFKEEQFALFHPGGSLGRRLTLKVADLMKSDPFVARLAPTANMETVVAAATEKPLGAVVVEEKGQFLGLITEGDIRRALKLKEKFFLQSAKDIMTKNPVTISAEEKATSGLELMENRPSQISVLPVIETQNGLTRCVGLLRLHDLIGQL